MKRSARAAQIGGSGARSLYPSQTGRWVSCRTGQGQASRSCVRVRSYPWGRCNTTTTFAMCSSASGIISVYQHQVTESKIQALCRFQMTPLTLSTIKDTAPNSPSRCYIDAKLQRLGVHSKNKVRLSLGRGHV